MNSGTLLKAGNTIMANKRQKLKTKTVILKKHIKHALWDGLRIEQKIIKIALICLPLKYYKRMQIRDLVCYNLACNSQ